MRAWESLDVGVGYEIAMRISSLADNNRREGSLLHFTAAERRPSGGEGR